MTATDWVVLLAGIGAIAWVNWYFFMAERASASAATTAGGVQEIGIRIDGGYSPSTIRVKRGVPVRLVFDRQERSSCSEEVVFGDFGIRRFLPAFEKTVVELTPKDSGTYEFTCGMGMMHGQMVVEETRGKGQGVRGEG